MSALATVRNMDRKLSAMVEALEDNAETRRPPAFVGSADELGEHLKIIESRTVERLPGGSTITTFTLSGKAREGLTVERDKQAKKSGALARAVVSASSRKPRR